MVIPHALSALLHDALVPSSVTAQAGSVLPVLKLVEASLPYKSRGKAKIIPLIALHETGVRSER